MDYESIKKLIKVFEASSLSSLEAEENGFKIKMERGVKAVYADAPKINDASEVIETALKSPPKVNKAVGDDCIDFNKIKEVKAPLIGVFYGSPSPDSEPFVKIGSKVKKGDTLCIIEAMKMMNEINAECDGEVVDICVQNGQVVEYSQLLFKLF